MFFCFFFGSFREMAKFQKIAPRVGESSKIEGWRLRDRAKIDEKSLRKRDEKMYRKTIAKWSQNGAQMEPKWSQNGIQKSMFFGVVFWVLPETSMGLRVGLGGAATGTLSPADPPGRRHFIKEYCTIIYKQGCSTRSNTPWAVGPANYREERRIDSI